MNIQRLTTRLLAPALAIAFAAACAPRARPNLAPPPEAALEAKGRELVDAARALIGAPYLNGGTTPAGFDCSGFVRYVFGEVGISVPRAMVEMEATGERVERAEVRAGDVVFFAIDGRTISHVGIASGPDTFIHAPSSRGRVREESLKVAYWQTRFAEARRFIHR